MRTIHSGRVPDLRSASTTRSRLVAFLRRCPSSCASRSAASCRGASRSMRTMRSRTASAPMPASKSAGRRGRRCRTCGRGRGSSSRRASSRQEVARLEARRSRPWPCGSPPGARRPRRCRRSCSASSSALFSRRVSSMRCRIVASCWPRSPGSPSLTRSISSAAASLSVALSASLPPRSPAATMTSPVGSKTMAASAAPLPSALSARRGALLGLDELRGAALALLPRAPP